MGPFSLLLECSDSNQNRGWLQIIVYRVKQYVSTVYTCEVPTNISSPQCAPRLWDLSEFLLVGDTRIESTSGCPSPLSLSHVVCRLLLCGNLYSRTAQVRLRGLAAVWTRINYARAVKRRFRFQAAPHRILLPAIV